MNCEDNKWNIWISKRYNHCIRYQFHMKSSHGIVLPQIRWGGRRGRSFGDLQGAVPAGFEVVGVPGRGISVKGKHSGYIEV